MGRKAIDDRTSSQIRVNSLVWSKVRVIAKQERRSLNAQVEVYLAAGVERYESEHGPIMLPDESDDSDN